MRYIIRSRLASLAIIPLLLLSSSACTTPEECFYYTEEHCFPIEDLNYRSACMLFIANLCYRFVPVAEMAHDCTENPEECASTFDQMQLAAIEFCEEYPEECQEAFDAWVESSDTEATE